MDLKKKRETWTLIEIFTEYLIFTEITLVGLSLGKSNAYWCKFSTQNGHQDEVSVDNY